MAPTPIQRVASAFNSTTSPKNAALTSVSAGQLIVVKAIDGNFETAAPFGTPTGITGASWSQRVNIGRNNANCRAAIWTTTVPVGISGSVSPSVTRSVTGADFGVEIIQYPSTCSVGANVWSGQITTGTGTPSAAQSTTAANSALEMAALDFNAVAVGTPAYITATAGTFTQT